MNILIFGVSSFIGFNIANYLIKKFNITATISSSINNYTGIKKKRINKLGKKIKLLKCDIKNKNSLQNIISTYSPDIIINTAGYTKNYNTYEFDLKKGYPVNVKAVKNIVSILNNNKNKKLYIHIGSSWEYSQKIKKCTENSKKKPNLPYGAQKLKVTNYLKNYHGNNIKIIVLRPFNILGNLDNNKKFFPYLLNNLRKKRPSTLSSCGQSRDYIHINDLSKAIEKILQKIHILKKFEIFNVCRGKPVKLKDLSLKLCTILKAKNNLIKYDPKKDRVFENKIFFGSNKKINKLTSWKPMKIDQSLKLLVKKDD